MSCTWAQKNESLETFVQSCSGRILTTEAKMLSLNKDQSSTITRITLNTVLSFAPNQAKLTCINSTRLISENKNSSLSHDVTDLSFNFIKEYKQDETRRESILTASISAFLILCLEWQLYDSVKIKSEKCYTLADIFHLPVM